MTPPVVLTIAGSDPTGGAGVQADLATLAAHRCHGASAITAVTAQTSRGVSAIHRVPPSIVAAQIDAALEELPVAAVKLGMVPDPATAAVIVERRARFPHLVVDPVLRASSGGELGDLGAVARLVALATVATPNAAEAARLLGRALDGPHDLAAAAAALAARGPRAVVVTGGDLTGGEVVDAVVTPRGARLLRAPRIATRNVRGTGCTFAAAIAAGLAAGRELDDAIDGAHAYVRAALAAAADWRLGALAGPLDHFPAGAAGEPDQRRSA